MSRLALNLGCGHTPIPGFINVDYYAPEADQQVDLYRFPWPWDTDSADTIAAHHFLEHVPDLEQTLLEIHRVLKPGGTFWVKVPHGRGWTACCIGHRHFFTWYTFHSLCHDLWYQWPQPRLFDQLSFRMRLLNGCIAWTPLDCIASRWPRLWEQFMPIPPIEIEWKGRAIKVAAAEARPGALSGGGHAEQPPSP